jgi:hypothetical protein
MQLYTRWHERFAVDGIMQISYADSMSGFFRASVAAGG